MGSEEQAPVNFEIWMDDRRVAMCCENLDALEITPEYEADEPLLIGAVAPMAVSMNIALPKAWRCANKKRFIRLLMSHGCDRNIAAEMAKVVPIMRGRKSYQGLWFEVMFLFSMEQIQRKG